MEIANSREEQMGSAPLVPLMLKMSLPAIAAQFINLLYSLVDRVYIGHIPEIGSDALAGVGLTGSVIMLISAFSGFVSGGGAPRAAMALGHGDREKAERYLGNGMLLLLLFTGLLLALVLPLKKPLLYLIGASETIYPYASSYLTVYLTGTLFVMVTVGLNNFITAQGRSEIAMIAVIAGALLNIALDPLFIFTFDMGVTGAALATVISQAVSACVVVGFLVSKKATLRLRLSRLRPEAAILRGILSLGVASFTMAATESFIGFVLNGGLQRWGGDLYVSALTVMQSAMQVIGIPLSGFSQGVTPLISYNFGAGNTARVRRTYYLSLGVMFSVNLLLTLTMILFPGTVAAIFTDDAALIALVKRTMPMFLAGMTIFGLQRACQFTFVALGQSVISLFIALLRKVILLIPLALILPHLFGLGVTGVYLAEPIADATAAIVCTILFFANFERILARKGKDSAEK